MVPCASLPWPMNPLQGSGVSDRSPANPLWCRAHPCRGPLNPLQGSGVSARSRCGAVRILAVADEPSTGIGRVGSLAGEPSAGIGVVPCASLPWPLNPLQGSGVSDRSPANPLRGSVWCRAHILAVADEPSTGIGRVGSLAGEPSAGIGVVPCASLPWPMNPLQGSGVSDRSPANPLRGSVWCRAHPAVDG